MPERRARIVLSVTLELAEREDYEGEATSWQEAAEYEASLLSLNHENGVEVLSVAERVDVLGENRPHEPWEAPEARALLATDDEEDGDA